MTSNLSNSRCISESTIIEWELTWKLAIRSSAMRRKRRRLSEESGGMVPDFGGLLLDSTADGRLGGAVAKDRLRKNRWGKMKNN